MFFPSFTDAHAHLPAEPERDANLRVPAGARILLNAAKLEDFPRVAALAKKFPGRIVPAFGVHPWFAEEWNSDAKRILRERLAEAAPGEVAVGEIGLDRCRGNASDQETAFREQLALAAELHVPATVHCVRAFGKTEAVLREFSAAGTLPPILLHAYCGSPEQARAFARLGEICFSAPKKPLPPECVVVPESDAPLRSR